MQKLNILLKYKFGGNEHPMKNDLNAKNGLYLKPGKLIKLNLTNDTSKVVIFIMKESLFVF